MFMPGSVDELSIDEILASIKKYVTTEKSNGDNGFFSKTLESDFSEENAKHKNGTNLLDNVEPICLTPLIDLAPPTLSLREGEANHHIDPSAAFVHDNFPVLHQNSEKIKQMPLMAVEATGYCVGAGNGMQKDGADGVGYQKNAGDAWNGGNDGEAGSGGGGAMQLPRFMCMAAEHAKAGESAKEREKTELLDGAREDVLPDCGAALLECGAASPECETILLEPETATPEYDAARPESEIVSLKHRAVSLNGEAILPEPEVSPQEPETAPQECAVAPQEREEAGDVARILHGFMTSVGNLTRAAEEKRKQKDYTGNFDDFIKEEIKKAIAKWVENNMEEIVENAARKELRRIVDTLII
jgi:cell pole-organizing protein PopZ